MAEAPVGGAAVVFATLPKVQAVIAQAGLRLSIAAVNAPQQTVISGLESEVSRALATFEAAGMAARRLPINTPAHSPLMAPVAQAFELKARAIEMRAPTCAWMSSFRAEKMWQPDAKYWSDQLLQTVQFSGAVTQALQEGIDLFVELAPTSGLSACIEAIAGSSAVVVAIGARTEDEVSTALRCVGDIWSSGFDLQLERLAQGKVQPSPFVAGSRQPRRLWLEPAVPPPTHQDGQWLRGGQISSIVDHRTGGKSTAPAALLVDKLLARTTGPGAVGLTKVLVRAPLELGQGQARQLNIESSPDGLRLSTMESGQQAVLHMSAEVVVDPPRTFDRIDLGAVRARCERAVEPVQLYELLAASGFEVGPRMRGVHSVRVSERELIAELRTPVGADTGHWIDPALLDGASQAVAACFIGQTAALTPYLGFSIGAISVWRPVKRSCIAVVQLRSAPSASNSVLRYDILLTDEAGALLAEVRDFSAKRYEPTHAPQLPEPESQSVRPRASSFWGPSAPSPAEPWRPPAPTDTSISMLPTPSVISQAPSRVPGYADSPSFSAQAVVACLREEVSARVRRPAQTIGLDEPLAHLGLDSMKAVDLVAALERRYGVTLPATFLFEARTLREAADKLRVVMGAY